MTNFDDIDFLLLLRLEERLTQSAIEQFVERIRILQGLTTASYICPSLAVWIIKDPCLALAYGDVLVEHGQANGCEPGQATNKLVNWTFVPRFEKNIQDMLRQPGSGVGPHALIIPVRGANEGPTALFIATSDEPLDEWNARLAELLITLTRATYYLDLCVHRLHSHEPPADRGALTDLEIRALALAAERNDATQVGRLMRISSATAKAYLESARHKLGAFNQTHALWKAIRLNLVD